MKRWVRYETVTMKFEDTPAWKMIEWILALSSEFHRLNNQSQVIARQEARLLDWYRPRDYPIGYRTEKAPDWWKILIPDYPNATYIKEALEWYANGILSSISEVWNFLEQKWLDLSRYNKRKKKDNSVNNATIWRMLKNKLYAWIIEYKKITRDKDWIIKKQRDISAREGKHEGLISLETFEKIQEKLTGKRPYTHETKVINDDYPLRWYIVCSCCWLAFTSWKSRGKSWIQIAYYQFNRKCIYKWKSVPSKNLHNIIDEEIKNIWVGKELLTLMRILITEEFEQRKEGKKNNSIQIEKEIHRLDNEMNNLIDTLASTSSEIVRQKINQKIENNELDKIKLENKLKDLENNKAILKTLDLAFEILWNPHYIRTHWTIDQKQMLLNLMFSKKIPVEFSTRTYWTLPFNRLYLVSGDILNTNSQHLEMAGFEPASRSQDEDSVPL